jgi:hypothetical protein
LVREKGIQALIALPGTDHGLRAGRAPLGGRVEQTFALLHWFRCLRVRWEIHGDIHEAFLSLACGVICWRRLRNVPLS